MKVADFYLFYAAAALCGVPPGTVAAAPGPELNDRGLPGGLVGGVVDQLDQNISGLLDNIHDAVEAADRDKVIDLLHKLKPAKTPNTVEEAVSTIQKIVTSDPSGLVDLQSQLVANGIISGSIEELFQYAQGFLEPESGNSNNNPDPPSAVYPKVASCDSPYSLTESELRSAIYIPDTFTYGKKPPVILFPGTGTTGYTAFKGNFIPLLTNVEWADPVWVNVPHLLLDDAQLNAEYAAYTINYIASLTKSDVSIVSWSQGCLSTQWSFKYWPSTRNVTSDHIAISGDYKGTIMANLLEPALLINSPSVLQQAQGAKFTEVLGADGGDSAYVTTTTVYSAFFDEIVQPQSGTGASGYMKDGRGVGVTNNEVQSVCKGGLAGTFYTHESILVNPLAFALIKDAVQHDGPGDPSRLDLDTVCSTYTAPGLGLSDLLITENSILIAVIALVLYFPKSYQEPNIMAYADTAPSAC